MTTDIRMNNGYLSHAPPSDASEIHARNHETAIVMLSGGLDSTAALWWALDRYPVVKAIVADYNQPHKREVEYAVAIAKMAGVAYDIVHVDLPPTFWGLQNRLTRGQACLMTALAALDIGHGGADIVHGILRTDDYGDCDRAFLDSLAGVLFHPEDVKPIGVATPLRAFARKADVIAYAYGEGAPILRTWTCRAPVRGKPCGVCVQCGQRARAFQAFEEQYGVTGAETAPWFASFASPYLPLVGRELSEALRADLKTLLENGVARKGAPALCTRAPDGTLRIASRIRYLPRGARRRGMRLRPMLSAHGFTEAGVRWELCLAPDGETAATEYLPDNDTIVRALLQNISL